MLYVLESFQLKIMANLTELEVKLSTLEDFKGEKYDFISKWLQNNGMEKLCSVFEGILIL